MRRLPALTPRKVLQALQRGGFYVVRSKGGHMAMRHPAKPGVLVTVAMHTTDMRQGTLRSVIRQSGLSIDEFLELL